MADSIEPALAALAGSAIGGLTTLAVTWITQKNQLRSSLAAHGRATRENLYKLFIEEASKLYGDALVSNALEIPMLIGAYALTSRMRVLSSLETVQQAEAVLRKIVDLYSSPNKTAADLSKDIDNHNSTSSAISTARRGGSY